MPVNLDGITPAGGELLELLEKGLLTPYGAHYVTTLSDGSEGDTYDMYNLPPLVRIDTTPPGEQTPSSRLISKEGGGAVTCDRVTESWECLPLEGQSTDVLTGSGPIVYPGQLELKSTVSEVQGRPIAGQQTRCFEIASQQSGTASTYCVTPGGVVLFASTEFGTTEAVLYDPAVSEDEFVVP